MQWTLFSNATDQTTWMTLKYISLSKDATSWMMPSIEPCWHRQNYRERKQISEYQKLAVDKMTVEGPAKSFGIMALFYILMMVLVTQWYAFLQTHRTVH